MTSKTKQRPQDLLKSIMNVHEDDLMARINRLKEQLSEQTTENARLRKIATQVFLKMRPLVPKEVLVEWDAKICEWAKSA